MKTLITTIFGLLALGAVNAQEDPDTTRMTIGGKELIIISRAPVEVNVNDTIDAAPDEKERKSIEAHWAGIEFGPTILLNDAMKSSFPNDPQWENDPGKSFSWNWNILEHKFRIYRNHIGVTTGLGLNWTQIGLKQYVLNTNNDSLWTTIDTLETYDKNKLRAIYLTAPLMLELCTNGDSDDNGFYLAAGVIGGVRIGSSVKRVIEEDKRDQKEKLKGTYALNAFRLDAAVRMGYNHWGVFANYNLLPLFDTDKTAAVYPLTFGLSYNF